MQSDVALPLSPQSIHRGGRLLTLQFCQLNDMKPNRSDAELEAARAVLAPSVIIRAYEVYQAIPPPASDGALVA